MWSFLLFDATMRYMLYCSQNLHTAYTDQGTERILQSMTHMKVRKLTKPLSFQVQTQDFQDHKAWSRPL